MLKIVLFQPEIAGNVGAIIRCCACFDAEFHVIEPLGFPFDLQRIKRSAMDYIESVKIYRHPSFENFFEENILKNKNRLILASTKGRQDVQEFKFEENDFILFGKESAGAPDFIHSKADHKVLIKMKNNQRSLNLAISCGIFLSKASFDISDAKPNFEI
jgi:tRNA (cytidine/uridine-2'-O-)-methyltransferase